MRLITNEDGWVFVDEKGRRIADSMDVPLDIEIIVSLLMEIRDLLREIKGEPE